MFKIQKLKTWLLSVYLWLMQLAPSWAAASEAKTDDPLTTTNDFAERMIAVVQGPVLKVLAAVVLLVGVAGLLRGRHKLAVSCGAAFLLLLFLPILLDHVAASK